MLFERHLYQQVDPRVCGETDRFAAPIFRIEGRSPRVRGNRRSAGGRFVAPGSIPACAGKPMVRPSSIRSSAVDPRVCGETYDVTADEWPS